MSTPRPYSSERGQKRTGREQKLTRGPDTGQTLCGRPLRYVSFPFYRKGKGAEPHRAWRICWRGKHWSWDSNLQTSYGSARALPPAPHCLRKKGSEGRRGRERTSATLLKSKNREIQLLPSHPLPQLCVCFFKKQSSPG